MTEEEKEITTEGAAALSGAFQNPLVLGALQERLGSLVGKPSHYLESLGVDVRKRIDALQNIQDQSNLLDAQFRMAVLELEKKFLENHRPLYQKRFEIISGKYEPTEEECSRGETIEGDKEPTAKGIPEFWLTALKNVDEIAPLITEDDEHVLANLIDIRLEYLLENPGFRLVFVFAQNDYFTNETLTKTYHFAKPEDIDATEMVYQQAEGSSINWKDGKDVSVTIEVKKQRHKATKKTRTVKKTVSKPTFFDFFNPPDAADEEAEDIETRIEQDYEIGELIKEKLIPYAVDYFTGKIYEYDDSSDEDYDDNGDSEEEGEQSKPECKQQ